ncbi:restriction endonuclease subunit S [Bacillus canaveralius]|uniref:Restriction endonuclease subunit S n=1 Tax=Bacillus canaveralius TaxID=1403243 RepID=A0A2N5GLS6_9BACI|nr:restriction endonuclease subunit S [Bacillus canaveralius]PLR82615.1 restriction endonuclease subunit S [Bacillus canaveralius]PLR91258.1 restriction endonuclease subunit S [Bacillus canaveralius]
MKSYRVIDLLDEIITGDWGQEPNGINDTKVLRTTNFTNVGHLDLDKEVVTRNIEQKKVNQKKLKYGDIIIEKSGGSPEQPVGRVVYFDVQGDDIYLCNNFTSILRPNSTKVDNRYLFYFLFYQHKIRTVLKYQNKTTGIINLKLDNYLNKSEIKLPSIKVQHRIVKILDSVFELIEKRKIQIETLGQLIQSVFLEMFGDPISNPKEWNISSCKDVTKKIGSGATPIGGNASYKVDGISLIRSMNVYNNRFNYKDLAFIDEEQAGKLNGVEVYKNDVLLNITGASVARSCIVPNDILPARVNQHVSIIRVKDDMVSYIFLNYLFTNEFYQKHLWQIATSGGATREAITKQQIEKLPIISPPHYLQNNFASIVQHIEKQKSLMQSSLVELENMYNALLQKAFKGELFS